MAGNRFINIAGERFGKLVVIKPMKTSGPRKGKHVVWECVCDCGGVTHVLSSSLRCGDTQSCGCSKGNHKHGGRHTRLYSIWTNIKTRTTNPNATRFSNYGGRGIKLCQDWANSFEAFRKWAESNGYADGLSIDRINNDGDYEPVNCRWANAALQSSNTRISLKLTHNGKTQTLNGWAREMGIGASTLSRRLKSGMPLDSALKKL